MKNIIVRLQDERGIFINYVFVPDGLRRDLLLIFAGSVYRCVTHIGAAYECFQRDPDMSAHCVDATSITSEEEFRSQEFRRP